MLCLHLSMAYSHESIIHAAFSGVGFSCCYHSPLSPNYNTVTWGEWVWYHLHIGDYLFSLSKPPSGASYELHEFEVWGGGGLTPCRHLRPSSGREHTIVQLIQSGDDDYLMNETRRKPTTRRQPPSLFDKWHGIFYMPSRIDEAWHNKAFDYQVAEHWGEIRNVQFRGWDSNRQHEGSEASFTRPPTPPSPAHPPNDCHKMKWPYTMFVFGIRRRPMLNVKL